METADVGAAKREGEGMPDGRGGESSTQSGGGGSNVVKPGREPDGSEVKVVVNVGVCSEIVGDGWTKLIHSGSGVKFNRIGSGAIEVTAPRYLPNTREGRVAQVLELLVAIIGE